MSDISEKIEDYLSSLPTWQRLHLVTFRELIHSASPKITEEWKWSVPVFMLGGKMLFSMAAFSSHTKLNFIGNGAALDDNEHVFNSGLDSKKSRSINLTENENIDREKLKSLIALAITKFS